MNFRTLRGLRVLRGELSVPTLIAPHPHWGTVVDTFTVNPEEPKVKDDYNAPSPGEMNSRNLTCNS
jgi:hypothetical protein